MGTLTGADMDQLEKWIGTGPKAFELLYSITKDGCNAQTFHTKCNNKGPTVTVLYNQQGSVYGGYTSVDWRTSNTYQQDASAFLYQLRFNGTATFRQFETNGNGNEIYDVHTHGPIFGYRNDLLTFSGKIQDSGGYFKLNGAMNIGNSFNNQGIHANKINNGNMIVTELEVYKVSDGKRVRERVRVVQPEQWRMTPVWNDKFLDRLIEDIVRYKGNPDIDITEANILLIGAVGAGKSSFYNTINSIFRGRITQRAGTGSAEHSMTDTYKKYKVRTNAGANLNFRLCDTRGLEESQGLEVEELKYLLEGNVPDLYQFNPAFPITEETVGFVKNQSVADKMHCVAFVVDSSTIDVIPANILQKIKRFQTIITRKGIPQVVLLSKVDKLSTNVKGDVSKVFKDVKVRDEVEKASQVFGLPCTNMLPLKNYEGEIELSDNVNILTLLALRQILNFTEDYMENLADIILADKNVNKKGIKE